MYFPFGRRSGFPPVDPLQENLMENTKATAADAELVLRLYDLRRESEMRNARNWFAGEFWPHSFSDLEQTMMQFGSPQSRYLGQVMSYWEMASSLVVRGALHPGLFYDACHEAWMCYAKIKPFLKECRAKFSPDFMVNLEKAVEGSAEGRKRLQETQERFVRFAAMIEESKKHKTPVSEAA
jgi:hypothetical protein